MKTEWGKCILVSTLLVLVLTGCKGSSDRATPTDVLQKTSRYEADGNHERDSEAKGGTIDIKDDLGTEEMTGDKADAINMRDYSKLSNDFYSWYIVRNTDHEISGADDSIPIEKYDACYADMGRQNATDDHKVMYLTFDCGYENGYTEKMLDVLKAHNAKACFFVTQTYIRDNVDIVRRMKEEGHIVGNHSVTHPSFPSLDVDEMKKEMNDCRSYMKEVTGYDMDMYARFPKGEYSERSLQVLKDLGYKTIFWSIAYLDYDVDKQPGAQYVIDHFKKYHHDGAIALIHNCSSSNAEALDRVLSDLSAEGYIFPGLDAIFR